MAAVVCSELRVLDRGNMRNEPRAETAAKPGGFVCNYLRSVLSLSLSLSVLFLCVACFLFAAFGLIVRCVAVCGCVGPVRVYMRADAVGLQNQPDIDLRWFPLYCRNGQVSPDFKRFTVWFRYLSSHPPHPPDPCQ